MNKKTENPGDITKQNAEIESAKDNGDKNGNNEDKNMDNEVNNFIKEIKGLPTNFFDNPSDLENFRSIIPIIDEEYLKIIKEEEETLKLQMEMNNKKNEINEEDIIIKDNIIIKNIQPEEDTQPEPIIEDKTEDFNSILEEQRMFDILERRDTFHSFQTLKQQSEKLKSVLEEKINNNQNQKDKSKETEENQSNSDEEDSDSKEEMFDWRSKSVF